MGTNPNLVGGSDGGARNDVAVTVGQEPAFQERKEESRGPFPLLTPTSSYFTPRKRKEKKTKSRHHASTLTKD